MRTVLNTAPGETPSERLYRFAFADAPLQSIPAAAPLELEDLPIVPIVAADDVSILNLRRDALVTLAQDISRENGTADIDISGAAFDFVRTIRVWRVDYFHHRESGRDDDCNVTDRTFLGTYGIQGDFSWAPSSGYVVPDWMNLRTSCGGSLYRGVGIEWHDYEGNHGYELVRY